MSTRILFVSDNVFSIDDCDFIAEEFTTGDCDSNAGDLTTLLFPKFILFTLNFGVALEIFDAPEDKGEDIFPFPIFGAVKF